MQKGFLDTALRITAIASMIIVTLCLMSFGLSQLRPDGHEMATATASPDGQNPVSPASTRTATGLPTAQSPQTQLPGPDPLAEHLAKLGKQLEQLSTNVSQNQSMEAKIARLADSMQATRQQTDQSDARLHQELGNLRVTSEIELRDLNRQVSTVVEKSQQLERDIVEHRAGILSALENQRNSLESQVARLEGGLKKVNSRLSDVPRFRQPALAVSEGRAISSLSPLSPVPTERSTNTTRPEATTTNWKKPLVLDHAPTPHESASETDRSTATATSTGWKVSPMSHSVPATSPSVPAPQMPLPPAPPAIDLSSEKRSTRPKSLRPAAASPIRAPLKSTLAPPSAKSLSRVPEIVEISHSASSDTVVTPIASDSSRTGQPFGKVSVKVTVIHVAASRPVDVEPAGVRMLNPELSATPYGLPWTHEAVTHELLGKVALRTTASIAGRQQLSIRPDETRQFSIGSSCPHCNEVHGFEAGDRLNLQWKPSSDSIGQFHATSQIAGNNQPLKSLPEFDLTPETGQTYVISEEAVEGTVEEAINAFPDESVSASGAVTSGARTRPKTQLMQRLIVITFLDDERSSDSEVTSSTESRGNSRNVLVAKENIALPAPAPARQTTARKLKPVRKHPVFLPPPEPASNREHAAGNSQIEFVNAEMLSDSSPALAHASHENDDQPCEICARKLASEAVDEDESEPSANPQDSNLLVRWFRKVRGDSPESASEIMNAEFETHQSRPTATPLSEKDNSQRRYVTKPGNRRPVR